MAEKTVFATVSTASYSAEEDNRGPARHDGTPASDDGTHPQASHQDTSDCTFTGPGHRTRTQSSTSMQSPRPHPQPATASTTARAAAATAWARLATIKTLAWTFASCLVFAALYSAFIHRVLIRGRPRVGAVLLDASTANLLVSVLSQVFVLLLDSTLRGLLDVVRIALAGTRRGTPASTFFGISSATGWLPAFRLALASRFMDVLCDFRCVQSCPAPCTVSVWFTLCVVLYIQYLSLI